MNARRTGGAQDSTVVEGQRFLSWYCDSGSYLLEVAGVAMKINHLSPSVNATLSQTVSVEKRRALSWQRDVMSYRTIRKDEPSLLKHLTMKPWSCVPQMKKIYQDLTQSGVGWYLQCCGAPQKFPSNCICEWSKNISCPVLIPNY